jgi:HSP20 family protein
MALPAVRSNGDPAGMVARWDPLRRFSGLQQTIDRLLESIFGNSRLAFDGVDALTSWPPLADLSETDAAYVLEVEVPGPKRDDVTIEVSGNELAATGECRQTDTTGVLRSRTRRAGRFAHRVMLPIEIDADKVAADLADGVLTVTVPKTESATTRRIEITTH